MKSYKFIHKYFSENLWYAKITFVLGGMGIGILLSNPLAGEHPIRWGAGLLLLSMLLTFYPLLTKKK